MFILQLSGYHPNILTKEKYPEIPGHGKEITGKCYCCKECNRGKEGYNWNEFSKTNIDQL